MDEKRTTYVVEAKLAEQAERYDDMIESMKKVTCLNQDLLTEERNLLSVAYKSVVGLRRSACRVVEASTEGTEELRSSYLEKIKKELSSLCLEVIAMLDDTLIPNARNMQNDESVVFYLKMKGDYYRYLVEAMCDENEDQEKSRKSYDEAYVLSNKKLPSTHPIRLGVALNFSVFFYDIEKDTEKACGLAKEALDVAISELDQLKDDMYKDSSLIMQLLRDNFTMWKTSEAEEEQDKNPS